MSTVAQVDDALPALRRLLDAANVAFKLVGGIAVVHHGYERFTDDIDALVQSDAMTRLEPFVAEHGFTVVSSTQLRHAASGVLVDLLIAGRGIPRTSDAVYPSPESVESSSTDSTIIGLVPLVSLKLHAGRHQDRADVVALLKQMDDAEYLALESSTPAAQRSALLLLRKDALEELAWEG